ncbi:MAG: helix-turn-helix transcriptional regulator, partial [Synergistaceae bacterium]|nr:helix-turn-helix transcriptional regulator [Synergistaceae bacterium]
METFGARLNRLRKEKGLKRCDIAEPLGVDAETIARYEREEREPKASDAVKIADVLGVSLEYLVTGVVSPQLRRASSYGADDRLLVPVIQCDDSHNQIPTPESVSHSTEHIVVPSSLIGRVDASKPLFAFVMRDNLFEKFSIRDTSCVVVNPAEPVADFDVALVFYKGKLALKRPQRNRDGSVCLLSGSNSD